MNSWKAIDYFNYKSGSKIWPSDDPEDSPYDTFTCKYCGYTFSVRVCGSFFVGGTFGMENAEDKMVEHVMKYHKAN